MLPGASDGARPNALASEGGKLVVRSQPELPSIQLNGRSIELRRRQRVTVRFDGTAIDVGCVRLLLIASTATFPDEPRRQCA